MKQIILSISVLSLMATATSSCKKTETSTTQRVLSKLTITKPDNAAYADVITFSYNDKKQRTQRVFNSATDPNANYTFTYTYNSAGQLISTFRDYVSASQVDKTFEHTYDAAGKLSKTQVKNNGVLDVVHEWNYSDANHPVRTTKNPSGAVLYTTTYTLQNGNVLGYTLIDSDPTKNYKIELTDYDSKKFCTWQDQFGYLNLDPVNNPGACKYIWTNTNTLSLHESYEKQYDSYDNVTSVKVYDEKQAHKLVSVHNYEWKDL